MIPRRTSNHGRPPRAGLSRVVPVINGGYGCRRSPAPPQLSTSHQGGYDLANGGCGCRRSPAPPQLSTSHQGGYDLANDGYGCRRSAAPPHFSTSHQGGYDLANGGYGCRRSPAPLQLSTSHQGGYDLANGGCGCRRPPAYPGAGNAPFSPRGGYNPHHLNDFDNINQDLELADAEFHDPMYRNIDDSVTSYHPGIHDYHHGDAASDRRPHRYKARLPSPYESLTSYHHGDAAFDRRPPCHDTSYHRDERLSNINAHLDGAVEESRGPRLAAALPCCDAGYHHTCDLLEGLDDRAVKESQGPPQSIARLADGSDGAAVRSYNNCARSGARSANGREDLDDKALEEGQDRPFARNNRSTTAPDRSSRARARETMFVDLTNDDLNARALEDAQDSSLARKNRSATAASRNSRREIMLDARQQQQHATVPIESSTSTSVAPDHGTSSVQSPIRARVQVPFGPPTRGSRELGAPPSTNRGMGSSNARAPTIKSTIKDLLMANDQEGLQRCLGFTRDMVDPPSPEEATKLLFSAMSELHSDLNGDNFYSPLCKTMGDWMVEFGILKRPLMKNGIYQMKNQGYTKSQRLTFLCRPLGLNPEDYISYTKF